MAAHELAPVHWITGVTTAVFNAGDWSAAAFVAEGPRVAALPATRAALLRTRTSRFRCDMHVRQSSRLVPRSRAGPQPHRLGWPGTGEVLPAILGGRGDPRREQSRIDCQLRHRMPVEIRPHRFGNRHDLAVRRHARRVFIRKEPKLLVLNRSRRRSRDCRDPHGRAFSRARATDPCATLRPPRCKQSPSRASL